MSDFKELVRRLQMHTPQETPFVCADAIRAIEKLSAEVERLKQERMTFVESLADAGIRAEEAEDEAERLKKELAEAREKAKAIDELEAWLRENPGCRAQANSLARSDEMSFRLDMVAQTAHRATTLAAAIRASLEKASGQGGE